MMEITVSGVDVGIKDFLQELRFLPHKVDFGAAALSGAKGGMNWLISDMGQGKSGNKYPYLPTQSSAPHETPAIQRYHPNGGGGDPYVDGLQVSEGQVSAESAIAYVVATAIHSVLLEFGTRYMLPRAPMRRLSERGREEIIEAVQKNLVLQFEALR